MRAAEEKESQGDPQMNRRNFLKRLAAVSALAPIAPALLRAAATPEAAAEELSDEELDLLYVPDAQPKDMLVPPGEYILMFSGETGEAGVKLLCDGEVVEWWTFDPPHNFPGALHAWSCFRAVHQPDRPTQFTVEGSRVEFTRSSRHSFHRVANLVDLDTARKCLTTPRS
jgi:hypothetical protein